LTNAGINVFYFLLLTTDADVLALLKSQLKAITVNLD